MPSALHVAPTSHVPFSVDISWFSFVNHGFASPSTSITFGWCSETQALEHIQATFAGQYDRSEFAHEVAPTIETPEQHVRCHHSA